jgi:hypothetical protein
MKDFNELKASVKNEGFGTAFYDHVNGDPVYLSRGVRDVFLGEGDIQKVIASVDQFQKGNYGSAEDYGKTPKPGHEYGRYDITDLPAEEGEDTGVRIHKDGNSIIAFYYFER